MEGRTIILAVSREIIEDDTSSYLIDLYRLRPYIQIDFEALKAAEEEALLND